MGAELHKLQRLAKNKIGSVTTISPLTRAGYSVTINKEARFQGGASEYRVQLLWHPDPGNIPLEPNFGLQILCEIDLANGGLDRENVVKVEFCEGWKPLRQ